MICGFLMISRLNLFSIAYIYIYIYIYIKDKNLYSEDDLFNGESGHAFSVLVVKSFHKFQ